MIHGCVALVSVLTLGWPILRCFENVPWSLISLKHHRVYKGQSKRRDIRSSVFSCFTYFGTCTLFSFPHLTLVIRSPWWAISSLMTRMNTARSMYKWRLISIPTKYLLAIGLKSYLKSKSPWAQKLVNFKPKQDSQIRGITGLIL